MMMICGRKPHGGFLAMMFVAAVAAVLPSGCNGQVFDQPKGLVETKSSLRGGDDGYVNCCVMG
jgi:hypothetical protein